MLNSTLNNHLHDLAKNIDYGLKIHQAKFVLVTSDRSAEGKSSFLQHCPPVLAELYDKRILIYDCQNDRNDILEKRMVPAHGRVHHFIHSTDSSGVDYIHEDDLTFLKSLPEEERASSSLTHFNEITKGYDVVFINMKTLKRAERSVIPALPIDGAIIIRSSHNVPEAEKHLTNELIDREIPIIGLVKNEGV